MSSIKLPGTTREQMIKALAASFDSLPQYATLDNWTKLMEKYFAGIGMKVYCHRTTQDNLSDYAESRGETDRYAQAEYHCDIENDIAVLNRDTKDPGDANSDKDFPRPEQSIFFNRPSQPDYICVAYDTLRKTADLYRITK